MAGYQKNIVIAMAGVGLAGVWGCPDLWVEDFANWLLEPQGYEIEVLGMYITASFADGNDVYLGTRSGDIFKADDSDLGKAWEQLSSPLDAGARLLFASRAGVLFASLDGRPLHRSDDGGQSWTVSLDVSVWRMDEDELGNLYAGNYADENVHVATLYKSADGGVTWAEIFRDEGNRHIHTVGWDDRGKRLYIAYGDGRRRGQAVSEDRGETFRVLAAGPGQGHTDVAFTRDYVIWASDDQSGRVFRVSRETGRSETLTGWSQFMWFAVTGDEQIFVGTITSRKQGGERAALLASADQGATWQKLLETPVSSGEYDQGFAAESRRLSAGGWLYCSDGQRSYRIRRRVVERAE